MSQIVKLLKHGKIYHVYFSLLTVFEFGKLPELPSLSFHGKVLDMYKEFSTSLQP